MYQKELIERARQTVALITSYSKDSEWAKQYSIMYEIFQENANKLNDALQEYRFDWDKEIKNEKDE